MGVCLYYCDVERDCPQAVGDEPAEDWKTSMQRSQCLCVCLYYCNVERDYPQAVGDEPAEDWKTSMQRSQCLCEQEIHPHACVHPLLH